MRARRRRCARARGRSLKIVMLATLATAGQLQCVMCRAPVRPGYLVFCASCAARLYA